MYFVHFWLMPLSTCQYLPVCIIPTNTRQYRRWLSSNKLCGVVDYIQKLSGMRTNELVETSQGRQAWLEPVVACAVRSSTTTRLERERETAARKIQR